MPGSEHDVDVEWSADVAQAEWIRPRLAPFRAGAVTSVVPGGFPAYARVLHPAYDGTEQRALRWREVAAHHGLEMRPGTHFAEIALTPPTGEEPPIPGLVGPEEGTLTAADADALTAVLRRHTTTPADCWFCLWDGYGWDAAVRYTTVDFLDSLPRIYSDEMPEGAEPAALPGRAVPGVGDGPTAGQPADDDPVPHEVREGPRVALPCREYLLYRGAVEAALAFVDSHQQTANLWWPADRAWCVATEIDLGWTYVAGSEQLIHALTTDDRLEAWRADPAESHHDRLPSWLQTAVDDAVTRLLAGHPAQVATSLGTASATMRRPGRLRRGDLWTTTTCADGSDGWGWSYLSPRADEETLRGNLEFQLTNELLHGLYY